MKDNFEIYREKFIDRLHGLMVEHKYKYNRALSQDVGIPERTINGWLNGETTPRMDAIIKLALFFNVTTDYIVGLEPD